MEIRYNNFNINNKDIFYKTMKGEDLDLINLRLSDFKNFQINYPNTEIGILYKNQDAIGHIIFVDIDRDNQVIEDFWINKKYRNKGYGKVFLSTHIAEMKKHKKIKHILLKTIFNNQMVAVKKLYLNLGFEVIEKKDDVVTLIYSYIKHFNG